MGHVLGRAAAQFGHVMFPSNLHLPVHELSEYFVTHGPGREWASRAFYSDDGSTGMEIAVKMAMRLSSLRRPVIGDDGGEIVEEIVAV